jgi:hypothetical protein
VNFHGISFFAVISSGGLFLLLKPGKAVNQWKIAGRRPLSFPAHTKKTPGEHAGGRKPSQSNQIKSKLTLFPPDAKAH